MESNATPLLDLDRLSAAKPETDPFTFLVAPRAVAGEGVERIIHDFPGIQGPRNHEIGTAPHGPVFDQLLAELAAPEFARLLGEKLGYPELETLPQNVSVRAECEHSDGNVHTDHWSKCVTVLVYPNRRFEGEGGRLRICRSKDVDDFAAEVPPVEGTLLAFKRSSRSYHGHLPFVGSRRVVQVSWLQTSPVARVAHGLSRRMTHAMKRLGLHPD